MSSTQADRLAEQIKEFVFRNTHPGLDRADLYFSVDALAALAKRQASGDARTSHCSKCNTPMACQDNEYKFCSPSAPQAAGAMECERCGESQQAHTPGGWCDNQSFVVTQGAQVREQAQAEPKGWECEIESADFEANTITVHMLTNDYTVRAGKHFLAPVAEASIKEKTNG